MLKFILVTTVAWLFPASVLAFGPGVHLELSLRLFEELPLLNLSLAQFLSESGWAFLYGNIAPDFLVGRAGWREHYHSLRAARRLLSCAFRPELKAFSLGYLFHLVTDDVAHNQIIPAFQRRLGLPPRFIHYLLEWSLERDRRFSFYLLRGLLLWPGRHSLDLFLTKALGLETRTYFYRRALYVLSYRLSLVKRRREPTTLVQLFRRCYPDISKRCLKTALETLISWEEKLEDLGLRSA